MTSREIAAWLNSEILDNLGYHLTLPEGPLEHYHLTARVRDCDRDTSRERAVITQFYRLIEGMKPFCLKPPDLLMNFNGADVATSEFVHVTRTYRIIESYTQIDIDFLGRVHNPPY